MQVLKDWVGRTEQRHDVVTESLVRRIAATVDDGNAPRHDVLPVLGHWCLFLPDEPMSELGEDGHPRRGSFLPPVDLPRRMWAGGEVAWHDRLEVGDVVTRTSRILDVEEKAGRSGPLVFVIVVHEISSGRGVAIVERQDLAFRGLPVGSAHATSGDVASTPDWQRVVVPTTALLARYSALTFNAHRIHYDQPYATGMEGYDDLVVHGPLLATMLAGLAEHQLGRRLASFRFRAERPVLVNAAFTVCGAQAVDGADLWVTDSIGRRCMQATATVS